MLRKKIVAGNWKMNNDLQETELLINELVAETNRCGCEVMIAPSFVCLKTAIDLLIDNDIEVVSQNVHQKSSGAYTGEVSEKMLSSIGVKTTIIGHSERREYFNETHDILKHKVDTSLENSMRIIFCFGEELKDRKSENHFSVISNQISESLFHLKESYWKNIVLAYEPVWAIGSGLIPEQSELIDTIDYIKGKVKGFKVLYGGSVNPKNINNLKNINSIDGFLIGGASQVSNNFIDIIKKTYN